MLPKTEAAQYAEENAHTTLLPSGKLRFDQTGMEFPAVVNRTVLEAYANGKAFRRALARRQNQSYDFSVHQPYIVPHKDRDERHFLYCTLTKATLPRDRGVIQNHVSTKRFQRLKKEHERAKKEQEEQVEKRREKRAQIAAARKAADRNSERKSSEADVAGPDASMEQDENDVLDGIISDDDESTNSDAEEKQAQETGNRADVQMEKEENTESDRMEEDQIQSEEKGSFWVRGRKGDRQNKVENDEDDDDEWEEPKKKNARTKRERKKHSSTKTTPNKSPARENDSQKQETVTGKRNRVTAHVPKKVRQARQRRKSGQI